jgi:hypothetical protein
MMLNLNKKKQQVYKKLAAQDRKQLKVESSLRFLLKSLFFDTVPMPRRTSEIVFMKIRLFSYKKLDLRRESVRRWGITHVTNINL